MLVGPLRHLALSETGCQMYADLKVRHVQVSSYFGLGAVRYCGVDDLILNSFTY